ncbi:MAG: DUF1326 domain-containing protein [Chloroflexi bacterium]|nr:DUF1326 domain-containing protein [Chloroflexota bacterium]
MAYELEGTLLEVCNCNILCPCWVGEDPDNGTCDSVMAYHIDKGHVNGTDLSGRTIALMVHIPGNVLAGNWKAVVYVDDGASDEQHQAMIDVWTGKLGGPAADVASLVGEVVSVERAPITYTVKDGKGKLVVGDVADCEMEPYKGATGGITTLNETIFSTIPGSPAVVSKASKYKRNTSQFGLKDIDLEGHNAIQGTFRFAA